MALLLKPYSLKPYCPLRSPSNRRRTLASLRLPLSAGQCSPLLFSASAGDQTGGRATARPREVPWSRDLANSVRLIGTVGAPVQLKTLSSGKAVAWTRIAVYKSATETTWVNLTFWDELAHVAHEHVDKGNQVYVSGRLVSDTVEGDGEKPQVYYKVVVQELNFVERSMPSVSLYEPQENRAYSGEIMSSMSSTSKSIEELWQAFFANPLEWWDNRRNKRNPKYPDFKHKDTGEALWIEGRYNPPWVKSQLEILDSRMASLQENERPSVSVMYADDVTPY